MEDGATFRVKSYFAVQFHALRQVLLIQQENKMKNKINFKNNEDASHVSDFSSSERLFIQSLSASVPWAATGGKSNSSFCKTCDDRFVVKCVTNHEFDMFLGRYSKAKERACIAYMESTVVLIFLFLFPPSNLFHCLYHLSHLF